MFFNDFFDFDGMHRDDFGGPFSRPVVTVDNRRLYNVLGVDSNADESQIRKAYRLLAKQNHPDKGGDSAKFQEINTAYEVLSNPEKRQLYDQYGEEALLSGGNETKKDQSYRKQTKNVRQKIVCSLEDLYKGKRINMKITHKVVCKACNGAGGGRGYMTVCTKCGGSGSLKVEMPGFFFAHYMDMTCDACRGGGAFIDETKQCAVCHGSRMVSESKQMSFYLERGMVTGSVIRLCGAADESPGLAAGDVLLVVQERPHPVFQRDGADLLMHMKVSVGEALCGFMRTFMHLDGRAVTVCCNPGEVVRPGATKVIPGEGMPVSNSGMQKGSLFITFDVEFPEQLSPQQVEVLRQAFNMPPHQLPEQSDNYVLQDLGNVEFGKSVPGYQKPMGDVSPEGSDDDQNVQSCPMQ